MKSFPVDFARNQSAKQFLENKKYESIEWIGWLDIDQTFPPQMFNILLDEAEKTGVKVLSATYFKRNDAKEVVGWKINYNNQIVEPVIDGTVQEVNVIGMGCCIIHRSVLEKIGYPWFKYGPLHEEVESITTEDIQFCDRCKEEGIKIYMHTGVISGHIMTMENTKNRLVAVDLNDSEIEGEVK